MWTSKNRGCYDRGHLRYPTSVQGFKEALTEAGYIEGKSGPSKDRQRQIARGFKDAGVDVVYSLTTPGTSIVKEVMPMETPVDFSIVTYPADSGLIESFDYS